MGRPREGPWRSPPTGTAIGPGRLVMADDSAFEELMRHVRAGDEEAAAELVRRYESKIRRVVRFNLDSRLQRHFDSMDVCQSVLASFFVRAGLGQYELHTPGQVLNLL